MLFGWFGKKEEGSSLLEAQTSPVVHGHVLWRVGQALYCVWCAVFGTFLVKKELNTIQNCQRPFLITVVGDSVEGDRLEVLEL